MAEDAYAKLESYFREQGARVSPTGRRVSDPGGQHVPDPGRFDWPVFPGLGPPDGTMTLFDPTSPDHDLLDALDQEMIAQGSAPMLLYRLDRRNSRMDHVTGESESREYMTPVPVVGSYEAPVPEQALTRYGIDEAQQEIVVKFNLTYLVREKGGQVFEGDVLRTYDGKIWEAVSSIVTQEDLWEKRHDEVTLKRVTGEGYRLPGVGDISDSPLRGSPDGHSPKGDGRDGTGGSEYETP